MGDWQVWQIVATIVVPTVIAIFSGTGAAMWAMNSIVDRRVGEVREEFRPVIAELRRDAKQNGERISRVEGVLSASDKEGRR